MPKDGIGEGKGKLDALQRAYEVDERRALDEKRRVDQVVEEREKLVGELESQRDALLRKLRNLRGEAKHAALRAGDGSQLASIERYKGRIQAQVAELETVLDRRQKELQTARDRAGLAEQDVIGARLEKKKVERILKNRADSVRAVTEATNEALTDELDFYRRKK